VPLTASPDAARTARIPAWRWLPQRVVFTPAALETAHGQAMHQRLEGLGLPIEHLPSNRLSGLRGEDERATYRRAKSTLAVVVAPPGKLKLSPIPPSADWQFHLAEGCPAHCQYCYLAGSLSGPPVVRAYANLPEILAATRAYDGTAQDPRSFEVSCYTDPLGIEHLTGSLAACITEFGRRPGARLRTVTKFDGVEGLLGLDHRGHTRQRFSVNALEASGRMEGGTAPLAARLAALRTLAAPVALGGGGYPVGLVVAPIMPVDGWREGYARLLDDVAAALDGLAPDLTVELITHRFTPGSKDVLLQWYPRTKLDLDEAARTRKRNKFGGVKFVYPREVMAELRGFIEGQLAAKLPAADVLYWT
jgi:spore photoproduct lyase